MALGPGMRWAPLVVGWAPLVVERHLGVAPGGFPLVLEGAAHACALPAAGAFQEGGPSPAAAEPLTPWLAGLCASAGKLTVCLGDHARLDAACAWEPRPGNALRGAQPAHGGPAAPPALWLPLPAAQQRCEERARAGLACPGVVCAPAALAPLAAPRCVLGPAVCDGGFACFRGSEGGRVCGDLGPGRRGR